MDIRLVGLALGTFAIGIEGFVVASLLPQIAGDTGVTLVQAGYLVVMFALAYALGAPVLAALTGSADRRVILAGSATTFVIGAILAALAPSYAFLTAARLIIGMSAGLYAATAQATAVAISESHHRARAISVIVGGTTLAVAFGAPLGALIASFAGWRGTYVFVALIGAAATTFVWFLLPRGLRADKLTLKQRLGVIRHPGLLPALVTMLLYMAGGFIVFTYIAAIAVQGTGLSREMVPLVLLAFGLGAALGNFVGGQLSDRFGPTRTVIAASFLNAASLMAISWIMQWPNEIAGPALIAVMVLWGVAAWMFPPAQASRVLAIAPESAPLALSLNGSALYLGIASGSLVGGLIIANIGLEYLGWIGGTLPLLGLVVMRLASVGARKTELSVA
ncbi:MULTISPECIES: MFS transporter [unclassified Phyllobacterium]|uniref:MFS transporter n=1 Tax=Phyllobacterium TaxID=28100 RepID=UPI000DD83548|nr:MULTISPECIES: MFS transporter [unclassified Phyllobacterium]MBA8899359.1 putative MFS family arabinose efflux permease [Phyllobacterium sp. P30BS-XVII]UGX85385.1 MFS transporter [Phyllobacterium sp. T1293]